MLEFQGAKLPKKNKKNIRKTSNIDHQNSSNIKHSKTHQTSTAVAAVTPGYTEESLESGAVPTVPVVDVAVTKQGSLMASGDVHGRVFLCPGWKDPRTHEFLQGNHCFFGKS